MIEHTFVEGILTLRLVHRKASALDIELLEALLNEFERARSAAEVRAVVLTGTGNIFCAGVDLFRLTQESADYTRRFMPLLSRCLRAIFAFPKPLIVAANGHAIAGGCILVLAADLRLMAASAGKIGVAELLVGVPFPSAALEITRHAVPRKTLQRLVYTGITLAPEDALAAGVIDETLESEQLLLCAQTHARQLAMIPAESFAMTKRFLREQSLARMDAAAEYDEAVIQVWLAENTRTLIRDYLARTVRRVAS